jgi:hypothetical protein
VGEHDARLTTNQSSRLIRSDAPGARDWTASPSATIRNGVDDDADLARQIAGAKVLPQHLALTLPAKTQHGRRVQNARADLIRR